MPLEIVAHIALQHETLPADLEPNILPNSSAEFGTHACSDIFDLRGQGEERAGNWH